MICRFLYNYTTMSINHDNNHFNSVDALSHEIEQLFEACANDIALGGFDLQKFADAPFSFDRLLGSRARLQRVFNTLRKNLKIKIESGVQASWYRGTKAQSDLLDKVKRTTPFTKPQLKKLQEVNVHALHAFQQRKVGGMTLSDRIWKITEGFKDEMEVALDLSIGKGKSAQQIAREVKHLLKHPDRTKARHRARFGKREALQQGEYISATKNAQRLARTENNMAYHTAQHDKIQQFDFVKGIRVKLSNNPNHCPFCASMAGDYPKDFKFTGWHPQCRCTTITILKTAEEMDADEDEYLRTGKITSEGAGVVKAPPLVFQEWLKNNNEKLLRAKSLPYFITDNDKYTSAKALIKQRESGKAQPKATETKANPPKAKKPNGFSEKRIKELRDDNWLIPPNFEKELIEVVNKNFKGFNPDGMGKIMENLFAQTSNGKSELSKAMFPVMKHGTQKVIGFEVNITNYDDLKLRRRFLLDDKGKKYVSHDYFAVPESEQGKGYGKILFRELYTQYKTTGVKRLEVGANIDVGGYAWGRYGFFSERKPEFLINTVSKRITIEENKQLFEWVNKCEKTGVWNMNVLTEYKWARKALKNTNWDGYLDFNNPLQVKLFESYIGAK